MADFEQYRDRRPNCPDPYQPTPKGCRHVAWGFSPRNEAPQPTQSPEGAQAARSDPLAACAPSGLDDFWDHPYLGLKPQALCRRPFGADNGPFSPPPNKSPTFRVPILRRAGAVLGLRVPADAAATRPPPRQGPSPDRAGGGQPADLRPLRRVPGPHREPGHGHDRARRPGCLPSLTTCWTRIMPARKEGLEGEVIRKALRSMESESNEGFTGPGRPSGRAPAESVLGGYPIWPAKWFIIRGLGRPVSELP